jgi:hypothetical protein
VIGFADWRSRLAFHGPGDRGDAMSAVKTNRKNRIETLLRGMLALALLAGVVWALTDGGANPPFDFVRLRG